MCVCVCSCECEHGHNVLVCQCVHVHVNVSFWIHGCEHACVIVYTCGGEYGHVPMGECICVCVCVCVCLSVWACSCVSVCFVDGCACASMYVAGVVMLLCVSVFIMHMCVRARG